MKKIEKHSERIQKIKHFISKYILGRNKLPIRKIFSEKT